MTPFVTSLLSGSKPQRRSSAGGARGSPRAGTAVSSALTPRAPRPPPLSHTPAAQSAARECRLGVPRRRADLPAPLHEEAFVSRRSGPLPSRELLLIHVVHARLAAAAAALRWRGLPGLESPPLLLAPAHGQQHGAARPGGRLRAPRGPNRPPRAALPAPSTPPPPVPARHRAPHRRGIYRPSLLPAELSHWPRRPSLTPRSRPPALPPARGKMAAVEAMALRPVVLRRAPAHSRGILTRPGPPRPRGPLPRTPWTTRGPPPDQLARVVERRPVREQVELDTVTYAGRQYFVPGLARPRFPPWDRGWREPWHSPGPRYEDMPLRKERGCFICHQRVRMLEGTRAVRSPEQPRPGWPQRGVWSAASGMWPSGQEGRGSGGVRPQKWPQGWNSATVTGRELGLCCLEMRGLRGDPRAACQCSKGGCENEGDRLEWVLLCRDEGKWLQTETREMCHP